MTRVEELVDWFTYGFVFNWIPDPEARKIVNEHISRIIQAVRDEEQANMKSVIETLECPNKDNCTICAYESVCNLVASCGAQEVHICILEEKITLLEESK